MGFMALLPRFQGGRRRLKACSERGINFWPVLISIVGAAAAQSFGPKFLAQAPEHVIYSVFTLVGPQKGLLGTGHRNLTHIEVFEN